jgi:chromosome segregation ATPase
LTAEKAKRAAQQQSAQEAAEGTARALGAAEARVASLESDRLGLGNRLRDLEAAAKGHAAAVGEWQAKHASVSDEVADAKARRAREAAERQEEAKALRAEVAAAEANARKLVDGALGELQASLAKSRAEEGRLSAELGRLREASTLAAKEATRAKHASTHFAAGAQAARVKLLVGKLTTKRAVRRAFAGWRVAGAALGAVASAQGRHQAQLEASERRQAVASAAEADRETAKHAAAAADAERRHAAEVRAAEESLAGRFAEVEDARGRLEELRVADQLEFLGVRQRIESELRMNRATRLCFVAARTAHRLVLKAWLRLRLRGAVRAAAKVTAAETARQATSARVQGLEKLEAARQEHGAAAFALQGQVDRAVAEAARLRREAQDAEVARLAAAAACAKESAALKAQWEGAAEDRGRTGVALAQCEAALAERTSLGASLKMRLDEATLDASGLREGLACAAAKQRATEDLLASARSVGDELTAAVRGLNAKVAEEQAAVLQAKEGAKAAQGQLARTLDDRERLGEDLASSRQELKRASAAGASLKAEVEAARDALDAAEAESNRLRRDLRKAEAASTDMAAEAKDRDALLASRLDELRAVGQARAECASDLAREKASVGALRRDLADALSGLTTTQQAASDARAKGAALAGLAQGRRLASVAKKLLAGGMARKRAFALWRLRASVLGECAAARAELTAKHAKLVEGLEAEHGEALKGQAASHASEQRDAREAAEGRAREASRLHAHAVEDLERNHAREHAAAADALGRALAEAKAAGAGAAEAREATRVQGLAAACAVKWRCVSAAASAAASAAKAASGRLAEEYAGAAQLMQVSGRVL